MSLDVIFRSLESTIKPPDNSISPFLLASVSASDPSEAQIFSAQTFLEAVYTDPSERGRNSRAQTPMSSGRANTPMTVWKPFPSSPWSQDITPSTPGEPPSRAHGILPPLVLPCGETPRSPRCSRKVRLGLQTIPEERPRPVQDGPVVVASNLHYCSYEKSCAKSSSQILKEPTPAINFPRRNLPPRPSALPKSPDVSHLTLELNPNSEYIVLVSMYEVYNDRIFDLLSPAIVPGQGSTVSRQGANMQQKDRRKHLFFKSTEGSPDRKLVAGLRKIACSTYEEALAILEIGLTERRVTGTSSNSVSSRSHGFFCLEVKRRMRSKRTGEETWIGNTLTVADLAGKTSTIMT